MNIYILGGGPTGMALAHGLNVGENGKFILLERGDNLGGMAQTVSWDGYGAHDLGPHKIFTLDEDLMAKVKAILPAENWLTRPKKSSIYMCGHFLPYPPSPFSLIKIYGILKFFIMIKSYVMARLKNTLGSRKHNTFEDDLVGRVGFELYKSLFKPIALKLWGEPKNLDIKLSQGRVQTPSLVEIVMRLLKVNKGSSFEAMEFIYPKGGLQTLWDSLRDTTQDKGEYHLGKKIVSLDVQDKRIVSIICKDNISKKENKIKIGDGDFIFSTLPISKVISLLGDGVNENIKNITQDIIHLNDLLLVFLAIDKPDLMGESWVFVPDPDICFHRISEQESFDPDMTPVGSIVCCEIMHNSIRDMGRFTDAELCSMVKEDLSKMGYKDFNVLSERVIRLRNSYPVFRPGFESGLITVLSELDQIKNFRTIGRQGAFNYIGTLDAMDIGYGAADWLNKNLESDPEISWELERKRTSHYPVLD